MMKFRSKAIGGLALAVAGITALSACSSSTSSGGGNTTNGNTTVPGGIGSVPAAGTPSGKAGTITYALQPGASPNLDLPAPEFRQQHGLQRLRVPVADVAAAVLAGERDRSGDRAEHEHRQPAGVLQRQQDRVDHDEEQLQVVGRQAHHRERPALRHRPDQGRGQGVSGELGDLHTRPVPRHPGKHLGAERLDAGDATSAAPSTRPGSPRTSSARDRRRSRCPASCGRRRRPAVRSSPRPTGPRPT